MKINVSKEKLKSFLPLFLSFLVIGVSGITLNTVLSAELSVEFFGDYSLALRVYLITGLISTLGLNISVLKYLSEDTEQRENNSRSLSSAMSLGLLSSLVIVAIVYPLSATIGGWFNSELSGIGLSLLVLGLPFFTLNKILLASLNAYRRYVMFSVYQALRPALILVLTCLVLFASNLPDEMVFYSFVLTEIILLIFLSISVFWFQKMQLRFDFKPWHKRHFNFGLRSLVSSAIADLQHSIDVIILGVLGTSFMVGVYTYAADVAKHLFVLSIILQTTINPEISTLWHKSKIKELLHMLNRNMRTTYVMYVPFIIIALVGYGILLKYIVNIEGETESFYVFAILCGGVLLFSGYKTVVSIFEFTGNPGIRVVIDAISLLSNIVLSVLLFQVMGLNGVALGTSLSFLATMVLIRQRSKNKLGLKLRLLGK